MVKITATAVLVEEVKTVVKLEVLLVPDEDDGAFCCQCLCNEILLQELQCCIILGVAAELLLELVQKIISDASANLLGIAGVDLLTLFRCVEFM